MACVTTLKGIPVECTSNVGGIRKAWICDYTDLTGITVGTQGMITEIAEGIFKGHEYCFKKNTSSMTSTLNVDAANGVNFVQTDLALVFSKQDTDKRIELSALSLGEVGVLVLDANGKYWLLGKEEPVTATAGGAETGTNRTDGNKYTITLTDYASTYPYEVDSAAAQKAINGGA